jgi:hypothetical protein
LLLNRPPALLDHPLQPRLAAPAPWLRDED